MGRIKLPKSVLELPSEERDEIIAVVKKAATLPDRKQLSTGSQDEHNIWARNAYPLMAEAEDGFYELLARTDLGALVSVYNALGLPASEVEKGFDMQFAAYEDELIKAYDSGRSKISDLVKQMGKASKERVMQWAADGKAMTRQQLNRLDKLMKRPLPNYAKAAEQYMVRAALIAKIRGKEEQEDLVLAGAIIDQLPKTIQAAEKEGFVLTRRQKEKAEAAGEKVKILPLTPLEAESVRHATLHAGDKITEISLKHMAGVRQLVIRAKKERWSAEELASKLRDTFDDHNRDWRRVAITELAFAHNDAFLSGCEEGDTLVGMGSDNACKRCKQHIIGKTVTVTHTVPKDESYYTDTGLVWAGKSNYGRRVAEYVTAIPLHPNCRCRWHKLSRFYHVVDGEIVKKDTATLINEERAKRGMKPDNTLPKEFTNDELRKMTEKLLGKGGQTE